MEGNKFKTQSGGRKLTPGTVRTSGLAFLKPAMVGAFTIALAIAAQGQSVWTSANGNWNSNGNNWNPNTLPSSNTDVQFGASAVGPNTVNARVNGQSVVSRSAIIGADSGRTATVTVEDTGNAGLWTASGPMYVGSAGTGTLTIQNGGEVTLSSGGGVIGQVGTGVGTVNVTGAGARWTMSTNGLSVGLGGQGSLTISGGGEVSAGSTTILGYNSGGSGTVLVTGAGSVLSTGTGLMVSRAGTGQLTIENGGRVQAGTTVLSLVSGSGTLNLNGAAGARGVLEVNSVQGGAGTEAFNINGGILKARTNGNLISNFEAGDVQILSGGAIIEVGSGISANVSSSLQGAGGLTKTGVGSLTFNSTDANSYQGTTVVQDGALVLDRAAADSGTVRNLEIGDGTGAAGSAVVRLDKNEQIKNDASVIIKSDGTFNLNGKSETVGTLTNQGGSFSTGAGKLTGTGATITWAGGTNTINSGGSVEDAHVVISGGTNVVEGGGNLIVLGGGDGLEISNASLTLDSSNTAAGTLTLRGEVTSTGTSSIATAGVLANAGTVDLDGGTRDFNVVSGQLEVSANITNGGLTKLGTGTMLVSGNSTYSGTTTVSNGTLNVSGSLSQTSSIAIGDGGTLMLSGTAGSSKVNDTASINLQDGSTLAFSAGLSNHTESLGMLTLSGNSIIDFGLGNADNILRFALSGAASWTGILSIYNYQVGHKIFFGTEDSLTSLTADQLNSIQFYSGAGTGLLGTGQWTGNDSGEVTFGSGLGEIVPVPEPATLISALLLLGIIGWSERGWLTRRGAIRLRQQAA